MRRVIWLQSPTIFWLGGRIISLLLNVHGVNYIRQTEIRTSERIVPEHSVFELEMAAEKLKSHKSLAIDQIPANFFKSEGRKFRYEIHKFINSIWNKKELSEERRGR